VQRGVLGLDHGGLGELLGGESAPAVLAATAVGVEAGVDDVLPALA
jgi:hypothetical protein